MILFHPLKMELASISRHLQHHTKTAHGYSAPSSTIWRGPSSCSTSATGPTHAIPIIDEDLPRDLLEEISDGVGDLLV